MNLPVGGQIKTNLPGPEPAKGGPVCQQCGAQLPNPMNPSNQAKGNLTNCSQCGASIKNTGNKNPFGQQATPSGFNQNIVVQPNMARVAQTVPMPSNSKVVSSPGNPMFERRVKDNAAALQPVIQDAGISDENAENTTSHHLESVNSSANALGL